MLANIRPSQPAQVEITAADDNADLEAVSCVLAGKPVLALCFDDMEVTLNNVAATVTCWHSHTCSEL